MIRAITLIGIVALTTGCVGPNVRTPDSVIILGNDCSNQPSLIQWRERQLNANQAMFESDLEYKQRVSAVKNEIWKIRYNCNPYHDTERVRQ